MGCADAISAWALGTVGMDCDVAIGGLGSDVSWLPDGNIGAEERPLAWVCVGILALVSGGEGLSEP